MNETQLLHKILPYRMYAVATLNRALLLRAKSTSNMCEKPGKLFPFYIKTGVKIRRIRSAAGFAITRLF
jgi:hypothetical protein